MQSNYWISEATLFTFCTPLTRLDYSDKHIVKQISKYNPSVLLHHYRSTGNQTDAINLLQTFRTTRTPQRVNEEIVYTYLYFGKQREAADYIKYFEFTNIRLRYLSCLIQIDSREYASLDGLYKLVYGCLRSKYIASVLEYFISCFREKHSGDLETAGGQYHSRAYEEALRVYLEKLLVLFTDEYISRLTYEEAKYLYGVMPKIKGRFLSRMVKTNPRIKYHYYRLYACEYGIDRDDILRILSAGYVEWAFRIAYDRGWVDRSVQAVIDRAVRRTPILLNRNGDWERSERGIIFYKPYAEHQYKYKYQQEDYRR